MYGIPIEDPRQGDEPLALYVERLSEELMVLVKRHHHPGQERSFKMEYCFIGSPRGKHSGIARIELIYGHENNSWRQVFAVTDSPEHGLRLWTEVRRHARKS